MRSAVALLLLSTACITELPDVEEPCNVWDETGIFEVKLDIDGMKRKAYVYVPPNSEGPRDMAFVLHGGGANARWFSEVTQHIRLANQMGNIVVYPQGRYVYIARGWNAGDCCGPLSEDNKDIDDVGFMEALVVDLRDRACGDRVLATGFSNGAMLTHRWACESDTVDVAIPTGGGKETSGPCKGEPLPIRQYHGVDDPVVPLEGPGDFNSIENSMASWRDRNQCDDVPPTVTTDGPMTCTEWACAAPTELCVIDDWGHMYPGGVRTSKGIDATVAGWDFFLDHAPPGAAELSASR